MNFQSQNMQKMRFAWTPLNGYSIYHASWHEIMPTGTILTIFFLLFKIDI